METPQHVTRRSTQTLSFCLRTRRTGSIQVDDRFDNVIEWRVLGGKSHAQLELVSLYLALANGALDLPLRCDVTPTSLRNLRTAMLKLLSSIVVLPKFFANTWGIGY